MKVFAFCVSVLALVALSSAGTARQKLKQVLSLDSHFTTCMTVYDMTEEDWYTEPEIVTGHYEESGNEERRRKNGCAVECLLKAENLMVDSDIKEDKIHAQITKEIKDTQIEAKSHKIAHDCVKEVKDITQECEKGFSLFTCVMKGIHRMAHHAEHDHVHEDEHAHEEHAQEEHASE